MLGEGEARTIKALDAKSRHQAANSARTFSETSLFAGIAASLGREHSPNNGVFTPCPRIGHLPRKVKALERASP
jgi:hypothetical protein